MFSIVSKAFWQNRSGPILLAVGMVLGIGYPFAVYFSRGTISTHGFILLALSLLILRCLALRSEAARLWRPPLLLTAVVLIGATALNADMAEKAYPALMSLAAAFVFAWSLRYPPSLIERFARLRQPELPLAASLYCRRVTMVWAGWLLINAAISAALATWGSLAAWTLWTGLLSYLAMGLLFISEFAIRHFMPSYRSGR